LIMAARFSPKTRTPLKVVLLENKFTVK